MRLKRTRGPSDPRQHTSRESGAITSAVHSVAFLVIVTVCLAPLQALGARTLDKSIGWPGRTLAGNECYGKGQNFGPFDYTDPEVARVGGYASHTMGQTSVRGLVEGAHFTPNVEQLVRGHRSGLDPLGDIDYTLRSFPNHHRALWAVTRYYLRKINEVGAETMRAQEAYGQGMTPPECYFQRAKVFAPEDKLVSVVFGIYLHKLGMLDAALKEYQQAEAKHPKHPELAYNMGLLYFDLNQIDKAQEYAERAKSLGYPLDGLFRKIQRKRAEADKSANPNY